MEEFKIISFLKNYIKKLRSESIECISIFGAGEVCKCIMEFLKTNGISVRAIFVSNNSLNCNDKIYGIDVKVYDKSLLLDREHILVASLGSKYEISLYLHKSLENINKSISIDIIKDDFDDSNLRCDLSSLVEFYLIDSFEIFHFLPIYNYLINQGINAKFIAEPCEINVAGTWFDHKNAIKILNNYNIDFCEKCNPNAKFSFSTQKASFLSKYYNYKINLSYGVGFTKDNFSFSKDSTEGFDVKLIHGNFQKKIINKYNLKTQLVDVGFPKHKEYVPFDKIQLKKELKIFTSKPVLVYFPTWDEYSSIEVYKDELFKLKNNFFIVSKSHHCTYRLNNKKVELDTLIKISDYVLPGNYSFEKAVCLGDLAICDAKSGALSEVAYLNPSIPIVGLCLETKKSDYLELLDSFCSTVTNPKDLLEKVKLAWKNDAYISNRKHFIKDIFSDSNLDELLNIINKIKVPL